MPSGRRHRLPKLRPGLLGGAKGEGRGPHQSRAALEVRQGALVDGEKERLVTDVDAALDVHPTSAPLEVGIGIEQGRQGRETIGRVHAGGQTTRSARNFSMAAAS